MTKPQKSKTAKRERMIGVKVTEDEYETVRVLAFQARKSVGAYVRDRVLPKSK